MNRTENKMEKIFSLVACNLLERKGVFVRNRTPEKPGAEGQISRHGALWYLDLDPDLDEDAAFRVFLRGCAVLSLHADTVVDGLAERWFDFAKEHAAKEQADGWYDLAKERSEAPCVYEMCSALLEI